jgi:hypothetical protein
MAKQNIMTVASLKKLLEKIENEIEDDFQVWLSSDEEGNEFLPVYDNPQLCLGIDKDEKKVIFFPAHC